MELNNVLEHLKSTPKGEFQEQWNSIRRDNRSGKTLSDFFYIQKIGELMSLTTSTNVLRFNLDDHWMMMCLGEMSQIKNSNDKQVSETKPVLF